MNKYQESLDFIRSTMIKSLKGRSDKRDLLIKFYINFEVLQELIDKYSKDSCEYHCQILDKLRERYYASDQLVERLEKALDKACILLEDGYEYPKERLEHMDATQWKIYLFKREFNDNEEETEDE